MLKASKNISDITSTRAFCDDLNILTLITAFCSRPPHFALTARLASCHQLSNLHPPDALLLDSSRTSPSSRSRRAGRQVASPPALPSTIRTDGNILPQQPAVCPRFSIRHPHNPHDSDLVFPVRRDSAATWAVYASQADNRRGNRLEVCPTCYVEISGMSAGANKALKGEKESGTLHSCFLFRGLGLVDRSQHE